MTVYLVLEETDDGPSVVAGFFDKDRTWKLYMTDENYYMEVLEVE